MAMLSCYWSLIPWKLYLCMVVTLTSVTSQVNKRFVLFFYKLQVTSIGKMSQSKSTHWQSNVILARHAFIHLNPQMNMCWLYSEMNIIYIYVDYVSMYLCLWLLKQKSKICAMRYLCPQMREREGCWKIDSRCKTQRNLQPFVYLNALSAIWVLPSWGRSNIFRFWGYFVFLGGGWGGHPWWDVD